MNNRKKEIYKDNYDFKTRSTKAKKVISNQGSSVKQKRPKKGRKTVEMVSFNRRSTTPTVVTIEMGSTLPKSRKNETDAKALQKISLYNCKSQ